jgi:hypothetical protein
MARIRSIKPEFFTSLTIGGLPPLVRLTFIGLWTHVDDDGRTVDDPRLIRSAIWPLDDRSSGDIQEDLQRLQEAGLITRYRVRGKPYLVVNTWGEHQKVSHPRASRYPGPEAADKEQKPAPVLDSGNPPEDSGEIPEDSMKPPPRAGAEQGAGSREQGLQIPDSNESGGDAPKSEDAARPAERLEVHARHNLTRKDLNTFRGDAAALIRKHLWLGKTVPPDAPPGWGIARDLDVWNRLVEDNHPEHVNGAIQAARAALKGDLRAGPLTMAVFAQTGRRDLIERAIAHWRRDQIRSAAPNNLGDLLGHRIAS